MISGYIRNYFVTGNLHTIRGMTAFCGVVENTLRNKLRVALDTKHLDVINESYMHNVPKSAETHFKVVVVSEKFEGLPLIKVRSSSYLLLCCRLYLL